MTKPPLTFAEPDPCYQPLKSMPVAAGGARFYQVIIDDVHAFLGPAKHDGPFNQSILELSALLMVPDLARRRLTDIDIQKLGTVSRGDALFRERRRVQHDVPPVPEPVPLSGVEEALPFVVPVGDAVPAVAATKFGELLPALPPSAPRSGLADVRSGKRPLSASS